MMRCVKQGSMAMSEPTYVLRWISIRHACAFVDKHHRRHQPPQGAIGAIACNLYGGDLIGVAIIGRPVAQLLNGTNTAEITRLCVLEGHPNAGSWLYTRAKRLAQAWGFDRVKTYTIPELGENGASLRAAGFRQTHMTDGGGHSRPSRHRDDTHPLNPKAAWEAPNA